MLVLKEEASYNFSKMIIYLNLISIAPNWSKIGRHYHKHNLSFGFKFSIPSVQLSFPSEFSFSIYHACLKEVCKSHPFRTKTKTYDEASNTVQRRIEGLVQQSDCVSNVQLCCLVLSQKFQTKCTLNDLSKFFGKRTCSDMNAVRRTKHGIA